MNTRYAFLITALFSQTMAVCQLAGRYADSIRLKYNIPEIAFAAVGSDTVFVKQILGVRRIHTNLTGRATDRFHLGSNTKAITAFIAAMLVEKGTLSWQTTFFDLFPELEHGSKQAYVSVTLEQLLTFRGKLPAFTYNTPKPTASDIKGDSVRQRYELARYFLRQKPMPEQNGLTPSNADYILAGLMLEKASGKSYKMLVTQFGTAQGIDFGFDYPNLLDATQPWGHDRLLTPLPPGPNNKLNWLLSAGNINVTLDDYIRFIQLHLKAIAGTSQILSQQMAVRLMFGLPEFSYGWFNKYDTVRHLQIAFNEGNAGAFITQVHVIKETNKAYIVFSNAATSDTEEGVSYIQQYLQLHY